MTPRSISLLRLLICLLCLGISGLSTEAYGALEVRLDSPFQEEMGSPIDSAPIPISMESNDGSDAGVPECMSSVSGGFGVALASERRWAADLVCDWLSVCPECCSPVTIKESIDQVPIV